MRTCEEQLENVITTFTRKAIFLKIRRLRDKRSTLNELGNKKTASPIVHNLSDKELMANQIKLLEKVAGFNTIDAKPIDFIGAIEPTVHHLNTSDEDKNPIRYTASNWVANNRSCWRAASYGHVGDETRKRFPQTAIGRSSTAAGPHHCGDLIIAHKVFS